MNQLKQKILKCLRTIGEDEMVIQCHIAKVPFFPETKVSKDTRRSEKARNEGNRHFRQSSHDSQTHHKIVHLYNESIAYAPNESEELAMAYGNKSAILLHLRKYAESIVEADKALKITSSASLKVKLLCRKAECYTALGESENIHCLERARFLLSKAELPEKVAKTMEDLTRKTQLLIEAGKLDIPKENRRRMMASKMIADAAETDPWASVKLEYSKKRGRHLVAARDFEPGEMIIVEKPFMSHLHDSMIFIYCCHCFQYLWTVVPCNHCAWRLFCSEKCRDETWDEFHDMECSILVEMKENSLFQSYHMIPLLISVFIKALKQAGSIDELQIELEALEKCKDERKKGFPADGKFASYKSMYLLPCRDFVGAEYEASIRISAIALIGLAKYSNILGTSYDFDEIKKLMKNDAAIFAGALIFKFCWMVNSRLTNIQLPDPGQVDAEKRRKTPLSEILKSLGYLFTLSCTPNSRSVLAGGNKHLMYALQPIKKGSPLTTSVASIYELIPKSQRQKAIQDFYHYTCNCQACTEDWFELTDNVHDLLNRKGEIVDIIGHELVQELDSICKELVTRFDKLHSCDVKMLARTKNIVQRAWEHYYMPSIVIFRAITTMMAVMDRFLTIDFEEAPACSR